MPRLHTAQTSRGNPSFSAMSLGVLRKDVERAGTDVAQTDDADLNRLHGVLL